MSKGKLVVTSEVAQLRKLSGLRTGQVERFLYSAIALTFAESD